MNKIDIVKTAFNFDTPPEVSNGYLSDDFQWSDSVGSPPMNKEAWIGMGEIMRASFPDVGNVIEEIRQEGENVFVVNHFTGTFKHDFDLSAMNMGVIPATGKAVKFPSSTVRVSFHGDKISGLQDLDTGPNAGMAGFLAALK
jgi:predicted ester cyclase